jgi:uncharacterized protein YcgL (UPF0745 family)
MQASDQRIFCTIYRCAREAEMYIYVPFGTSVENLPEPLLKRAGQLEEVMSLKLSSERKLARARTADVIKAIAERGFYLQLPMQLIPSQFSEGE